MNARKEVFEMWAKNKNYDLALDDEGRYFFEPTKNAWESWEEACRWMNGLVQVLREEVNAKC